jgi:hypothetical protein
VAAAHPQTDSVVDLHAAACPKGAFTTSLDGVAIRRSDGVHFTNMGGEVLAPALMPGILAAGHAQIADAAKAAAAASTTVPSTTIPGPSPPSTSVP